MEALFVDNTNGLVSLLLFLDLASPLEQKMTCGVRFWLFCGNTVPAVPETTFIDTRNSGLALPVFLCVGIARTDDGGHTVHVELPESGQLSRRNFGESDISFFLLRDRLYILP